MRRRGFTLVELLVVIGIISVLVGALMPALQKARRGAIMLQCAANLRQVGAAVQAYAVENRGVLPFAAMKVSPPGGGTHANMWCLSWDDLISDHLGGKLTTKEKEAAFNYRGLGTLVCPADPVAPAYNTAGVRRRSYALTRIGTANPADGKPFSGVAGQWSVGSLGAYVPNLKYQLKVTQVRAPAETFLAVEHANGWNVQGYDTGAYVDAPAQVSPYVVSSGDVLTVERARQTFHGGKWNFLYVDGHVAGLRLEETLRAGQPVDFGRAVGSWTRNALD